MFKRLSLLTAMLVAFALPAFAQTAVRQTTLSVAITSTNTTQVTLASATGVTAGTGLFVDREAMSVVSISGTIAQVIRGIDGSGVGTHASTTVVYVGAPANTLGQGPFWMSDPVYGTCTATNEQYTLRINVTAGRIWKCVNSQWAMINNPYPGAVFTTLAKGTVIASATTIAPTSYMTHVSGTVEVTTITVPAGCAQTCTIVLIPDAAFTLATGGNIAEASTADANQALFLVWDGSAWYPSY